MKEFRSDRHAILQLEEMVPPVHKSHAEYKSYVPRHQRREPLGWRIKLMLVLVGVMVLSIPLALQHVR